MLFEKQTLPILDEALKKLEEGFSSLPGLSEHIDAGKIRSVLCDVAERLQDNYPYFHPMYAGQMLKPPHPVARLAYMLALWINPNNHALDGGKASSVMEKEAVADLAEMFGWRAHLGHLCGGGTMANLEALWISGQLHNDKLILASELAHYTHERISKVLRLPFQKVKCAPDGTMDLDALEKLVSAGNVGTVVTTMGTTSLGSVDPLPEVVRLSKKYGFRVHADAAYGGYFILADNLEKRTREKFESLSEVDSIVIDPHKHGLQPYGCGCVLFKDPAVSRYYSHSSPATYFTSSELHLGEISLECSRPGASAVALWATHRLFPLEKNGEFARGLSKSRTAAVTLHDALSHDTRFFPILRPELDIVAWAVKGRSIAETSKRTSRVFELSAQRNLHLAKLNYPVELLGEHWSSISVDQPFVTCLRSCLMKEEHAEWVGDIFKTLSEVTDEVLRS